MFPNVKGHNWSVFQLALLKNNCIFHSLFYYSQTDKWISAPPFFVNQVNIEIFWLWKIFQINWMGDQRMYPQWRTPPTPRIALIDGFWFSKAKWIETSPLLDSYKSSLMIMLVSENKSTASHFNKGERLMASKWNMVHGMLFSLRKHECKWYWSTFFVVMQERCFQFSWQCVKGINSEHTPTHASPWECSVQWTIHTHTEASHPHTTETLVLANMCAMSGWCCAKNICHLKFARAICKHAGSQYTSSSFPHYLFSLS